VCYVLGMDLTITNLLLSIIAFCAAFDLIWRLT
jgi:hypothetical protein